MGAEVMGGVGAEVMVPEELLAPVPEELLVPGELVIGADVANIIGAIATTLGESIELETVVFLLTTTITTTTAIIIITIETIRNIIFGFIYIINYKLLR